jgi:hypothetical protein
VITIEVAELGPLLRPSLALLADTVENTDSAPPPSPPEGSKGVQAICDAANQAQQAFSAALGGLQTAGEDSISCGPAAMRDAASKCLAACHLLVDADVDARRHLRDSGGSHEAVTLALACRDIVVLAAHLLADLIRVLCDPGAVRVVGGGQACADGQVTLELGARFSTPDNARELAAWMPMRLAWRHDDVQTALRIAAMVPTPMQRHLRRPLEVSADFSQKPVAPPQKFGFWSALGWGTLLAWLFDR